MSLVPLYARRADFRAVATARAFKHRIYDEPRAREELSLWLGGLLGRGKQAEDGAPNGGPSIRTSTSR